MQTRSKITSHCGTLQLINCDWPIHQTSGKLVLREVAPGVYLASEAALALRQLLADCGAAGRIAAVSGYRSMAEQVQIYAAALTEHGEAFTRQYVAFPGCSEHQSGLAVDMALLQESIDPLTPHFPYEGICQHFREAAADFGFIERYPQGKEKVTGIAHEPWHFRYVGLPHAPIIQLLGITLEEYLQLLQDYSPARPYRYCYQGIEYYLYQANLQQAQTALEQANCQVSGDNRGGFILTQWS